MKLIETAAALTLATSVAALALDTSPAVLSLSTNMLAAQNHSHCIYRPTSHPETNIQFRKWDGVGCDGKPDAEHKVEHGLFLRCKNLLTLCYMR